MKIEDFEYYYIGLVTKVRDGDTIEVERDMQFNQFERNFAIRFKDVWCPETEGKDKELGYYVKDRLEEKIFGKRIVAHSFKYKEKSWDRYVAFVYLDGENISQWLIDMGYGTRYRKDLPKLKKKLKATLETSTIQTDQQSAKQ